jgi:hypothetical protein
MMNRTGESLIRVVFLTRIRHGALAFWILRFGGGVLPGAARPRMAPRTWMSPPNRSLNTARVQSYVRRAECRFLFLFRVTALDSCLLN